MNLYAVLLGGSGGPGRLAEDHETVFVVAEGDKAAKAAAKAKWSGLGRPHVDALSTIDAVDGYLIELREGAEGTSGSLVSYNDDPYDEPA
jgi:hypothetical protein